MGKNAQKLKLIKKIHTKIKALEYRHREYSKPGIQSAESKSCRSFVQRDPVEPVQGVGPGVPSVEGVVLVDESAVLVSPAKS